MTSTYRLSNLELKGDHSETQPSITLNTIGGVYGHDINIDKCFSNLQQYKKIVAK